MSPLLNVSKIYTNVNLIGILCVIKKHDTRGICLNGKETELTPSRNYRASPAATLTLSLLCSPASATSAAITVDSRPNSIKTTSKDVILMSNYAYKTLLLERETQRQKRLLM
ncbi:hypothetical protein R6Q59_017216 [Mikania micrantha]